MLTAEGRLLHGVLTPVSEWRGWAQQLEWTAQVARSECDSKARALSTPPHRLPGVDCVLENTFYLSSSPTISDTEFSTRQKWGFPTLKQWYPLYTLLSPQKKMSNKENKTKIHILLNKQNRKLKQKYKMMLSYSFRKKIECSSCHCFSNRSCKKSKNSKR